LLKKYRESNAWRSSHSSARPQVVTYTIDECAYTRKTERFMHVNMDVCICHSRDEVRRKHGSCLSLSHKLQCHLSKYSMTNLVIIYALPHLYRTHTFAQIFVYYFRINYVFKSNSKNSMVFICVIFVSGISNFVVTTCTFSISSTYCHELTARDAIFGLRNGNKYLI